MNKYLNDSLKILEPFREPPYWTERTYCIYVCICFNCMCICTFLWLTQYVTHLMGYHLNYIILN